MSEVLDRDRYSTLWSSFTIGDDEAFSELYRISYKDLYSYGLSFNVSSEQVRDVIHDLFIKLYSNPDLVKNTETVKPLLFRAIRNACINVLKIRQRHVDLDTADNFNIQYRIKENQIDSKIDEDHIKSTIENILSQLTPRQKEIIYLRFLHQMEYEEIARVMNMTEQSARNLLHRGIEKIRKENTKEDFFLFLAFILLYQ